MGSCGDNSALLIWPGNGAERGPPTTTCTASCNSCSNWPANWRPPVGSRYTELLTTGLANLTVGYSAKSVGGAAAGGTVRRDIRRRLSSPSVPVSNVRATSNSFQPLAGEKWSPVIVPADASLNPPKFSLCQTDEVKLSSQPLSRIQ